MSHRMLWVVPAVILCSCTPAGEGLQTSVALGSFDEVERTWTDSLSSVRICLNMPLKGTSHRTSAMLILYALPNGNTIEQTKGRKATKGLDWHFGIQHIAAQTRLLRQSLSDHDISIAYLEAPGLSWPRWRRERAGAGGLILKIVDSLRMTAGRPDSRVALTGHSGGGSFVFGFLDASDEIPSYVDRIGFLDSNYGFSDSLGYTAKLLHWLEADSCRALSVIAYDDREIRLDGKKVLGPDGGTYRRTLDMARSLGSKHELLRYRRDTLMVIEGMQGQIELLIHLNPANEILHTRLIGEMNGFLHAMTMKQREPIPFGGQAVYGEYVKE
jgi:hypothetical protein